MEPFRSWDKPESEQLGGYISKDPQFRTNWQSPHWDRGSEQKHPNFSFLSWISSLMQSRVTMGLIRSCSFWRLLVFREQPYSRTVVGVKPWKPRSTWDEGFCMMKKPSHISKFVLQANHETIWQEARQISDALWTLFYWKFFSADYFPQNSSA